MIAATHSIAAHAWSVRHISASSHSPNDRRRPPSRPLDVGHDDIGDRVDAVGRREAGLFHDPGEAPDRPGMDERPDIDLVSS